MIHVKETIIVEGKYDKIRLSSLVDANIIATDGFAIFKNKQKVSMLRALAQKNGLLILTDSDRAGFLIRRYLTQCVGQEGVVKQAYIPDVLGKERRKVEGSREGTLGVEGMTSEVLMLALRKAGISAQKGGDGLPRRSIALCDLYDDGLCGRDRSAEKRAFLLRALDLPRRLSTKELLRILNELYSYEEYKEELTKLDQAEGDAG